MIRINDKKLEAKIDEILKKSRFSSPLEYLSARVSADFLMLKKTNNPPI